MMNVILMGPPGVGKGTQAQFFISQKSFKHISTGDLFRKALREKTSIGKEAQAYLDAGKLVPDQVTIGLMENVLRTLSLNTALLFDGFPRTLIQAEALNPILEDRNQEVDLALSFKLSDEIVIKRLTGRRWAPKSGRIYHIETQAPKKAGFCDETGEVLVVRKDDQREVVKGRLEIFKKQDQILRDYYESKGVLQEISAEDSPKEIFRKILPFLER